MEQMFMKVFERQDRVAAQVQEQADSFRQTIACNFIAAGRRPPDWLLPSRPGGPQPELNGKLIPPGLVFSGSQITTPAANRNIFFHPAIPSTSIRIPEIINAVTQPVNNFAALSVHEEPQQEQISLSKELENACPVPNMFSRIQRSKSRQRSIEDRRRGRDQAANCGSCDGIRAAESNKTTMPSSSKSCVDVANNTETTSSCPGQANGSYASQGRSTDFLKWHSNLATQGNRLDCEGKAMSSHNNCPAPARDLEVVPLPDHSELNIANTMCHTMPETHLLVEPKKLRFDGADPACMDISEQTGQQQESALASAHFCLADRNRLSEDPYPASSSQEPHSMGRLSHGLKSAYLKSVDADLIHKQYGLESDSRDLCANSPNVEPSLSCSTEVPSFVGEPLLQKNMQNVTETISKLFQTQETGLLNSDERTCSGRSHFAVNPLLEKDILKTVEDTKKLEGSNSELSPSASSGPLQLPFQQADESFQANASGILTNSLLEENGHNHLSNLLTNDTSRQCSVDMSSVGMMELPSQPCMSNPSSHKTHSNGTQSNGFAAVDAFKSAENMLPQDQYSLSRPSLEFDGSVADADAPLDHPPPELHNKMLIGNTASELMNYHSGNLGADVHVNKKDQFVTQEVISSVSSGRNRMMHETERSTAVPSGKCNESLHQEGIEQGITPLDNDVHVPKNAEACLLENVEHMRSSRSSVQYCLRSSVSYEKNSQLQASRGNAQQGSAADGVQVNGGTTSKTKRIKCQDAPNSHSSRTNSLSLSNQDGTASLRVTTEELSGRSRPSGRYLLRSSGFKEFMSLESGKKNAAANSKIPVASDVLEKGDSSLEPIKNSHLANVGIWNSSSRESLSSRLSCSNDSRSAFEGMNFQSSRAGFQTNLDTAATSTLPSCSNIAPDIEECCTQEGHLCLKGMGLSSNSASMQHQKMAIQTDENVTLVNQENYSVIGSLTMLPSPDLDEHGKKTSGLVASLHKKLSFDSGVKLETRCEDPARFFLSDAKTPRQEGDESIDCYNTLPEFEHFNVSPDSPTTEKRTYEALHDSRRFGTLSPDIPRTYKVNTVSGMHQLGATMSEEATSCSFSGDIRQYSVSGDDRIADIFGSLGLEFSGSFVASCSSNGSDKHVSGENPFSPVFEKYSLGKLSARVGSVSEHMGSIPELDEASGIDEGNECQDMLTEAAANQVQSGRKVLQDVTGLFQNTENSALKSLGFIDTSNINLTTDTFSSKVDQNSGFKNGHNNKKPKESGASFVKKEGKVSHHLNRLSKTEVTNNRNQRSTGEANLGKRSKMSNIVTNVASFIPLVKPKPSTTIVKKDVRVKALEAAEAAKRLEEKKRNEREMRKAAAKLEREKMKKEKESKQKLEQEQRKKLDNDMATKKRQRDEEEKREKERKRRRAEEVRKHQKQPTEGRHPSDGKDAHLKASDNEEMRNNLVESVRSEVEPDDRVDLGNKAITSNNDILVDERPSTLVPHATENIPNSLDESYVMTPYKDSDDEDYDEEAEASRQRKKLKPSWVREEHLKEILLANQLLDAREIFRRKRSFYLSDVLPFHALLRGFR